MVPPLTWVLLVLCNQMPMPLQPLAFTRVRVAPLLPETSTMLDEHPYS